MKNRMADKRTDVYLKEHRADRAKELGICVECFEKAFEFLTDECDFVYMTRNSNMITSWDADAEAFITHNTLSDSNHSES